MSVLQRLILLLAATLVGGFFAVIGSGFSNAVEPESFSTPTEMFWLVFGAFFSVPLWLPAVVPNRFSVALTLCRRVSAALLCAHSYLFGASTVQIVTRSASELSVSSPWLLQSTVLFIACITSVAILLWPDLKANAKQTP